ncbi:hypothetical protein [Nonomuraea gerenzanensis]|uniref:Uncharacterized protein n=1 Tax=Nonomuraea gerenzanensis TaxID=93944 RepID=A0A1M4E705_9ACTN|nr:hypothetical protein [Nonomuraea gerenzanensis]UBU16869.1 hypothetical protein LCN96_18175 [Nonomuraea gerenzanensis]SBO94585.1 FIG01173952: hypothetical protein [Nonomuraea gerenzanensis]
MSIEWVNQAIDDLRAWGRTREVEVDADEVRLLCDYASDYLNVNELGDFTPETFDELLLSIYPRKVIAPPESAPETVAAARTLVDYLAEEGQVSGDTATRMRERLDDIASRMPEALADSSNFGMAKSLFSSIGPESLEQSVAIPSGELPDLGEAPCDCPGCTPLPAVRLAAPEELRAALGSVPMLEEEPLPEEAGDPLDAWAQRVTHLLEQDTGGAITGSAELDEGLYDLFDMLYRLQARVPVTVIGDYLDDLAGEGEADTAAVLERLERTGMVRVSGDGAELTPLAVWALREHYLSLGIDAPQAPDLAEADARGLIEGLLEGVPTELAEDDIGRWLSGREPAEAAAELLAAASGAPAVARGIAITIVDRLDVKAEPAVRDYLEDQELRPHAIHWLAARRLPAPPLTQEELLWVSVDMLALAMPAAEEDPEIFAENMAASGPPAHLIEEMWRVDHPDVVEVLELLGRSIPDGTVAKAARKAAFKARSRGIR